MSLPQGILWQRMRQRALDAIPPGSMVNFKAPLTLAKWQAQGTYTISSMGSSQFTIVAPSSDFGGALFSDAAFHLDHALEHQVSLMKILKNGQWSSPAWQVVTFYYWSYFSAMALSRLLGKTVWFITPDIADQLSRLAITGPYRVTQGTYEIDCGTPLSAGMRGIILAKKKRHFHKQLWITIFDLLQGIRGGIDTGTADPQEERLFLAILGSAQTLGNEWPSTFRNIVNYQPGFAYTAPRFKNCIDSFSYLCTPKQSINDVIGRLENNSIAMHSNPSVEAQPGIAAQMLVDITILISRIAQELHDELVDRNHIDQRWLASKRRFAQQQGLNLGGALWPC